MSVRLNRVGVWNDAPMRIHLAGYTIKPNFKELGKVLGPKMKSLQEILTKFTKADILEVQNGEKVVKLEGEDFTLTSEMVLITLKQKEGFTATTNDKTCVVLETTLTEELILEGLMREFVRVVQALRKDSDFVITDHIKVYFNGTDKVKAMMNNYKDYIMGEVLGDELIETNDELDMELNDEKVSIKVERI